jgi:ketosteroid isomerase-like protein
MSLRPYLILAAFIPISANADTTPKGKPMNENSIQIIRIINKLSEDMQKGNLAGAMAAYEPTASLVAQPGVTVTGTELLGAMKGYLSMKPKFDMPNHEVIEAGDIALHISPWSLEAVDPSSGHLVKQNGLSVAVFRKQRDGKWLMVIDDPHGSHLLMK